MIRAERAIQLHQAKLQVSLGARAQKCMKCPAGRHRTVNAVFKSGTEVKTSRNRDEGSRRNKRGGVNAVGVLRVTESTARRMINETGIDQAVTVETCKIGHKTKVDTGRLPQTHAEYMRLGGIFINDSVRFR